jgi:hypothetical protein
VNVARALVLSGIGFVLASTSLAGCGRTAPTQAQCEAAANNIVELFATENAIEGPIGVRVAENQRRNFTQSCLETGSASQAECAAQAGSVRELEACR